MIKFNAVERFYLRFKLWRKQLLCSHANQFFVRNLHGEAIIHSGWNRSVWRCYDCGKTLYRQQMHEELENGFD